MKVFVDADSFLKQMRDIVLRAAIKRNLDITFVADRSLKDVLIASESHTSILRKETLSNNPKIEKEELKKITSSIKMIIVESDSDSADNMIVDLANEGDLAITHDIPLIDRLAEKGVLVLDDRGNVFTDKNIKERLSIRNAMTELRSYGINVEKNKKMGSKEVRLFADAFSKTLDKYKEELRQN
ncbi:MAG: DUF188 domain-containing protein [Spirochaetia bacterium]|nr:DUF188 domain-containing protein [Spirochaetia bacterium]